VIDIAQITDTYYHITNDDIYTNSRISITTGADNKIYTNVCSVHSQYVVKSTYHNIISSSKILNKIHDKTG